MKKWLIGALSISILLNVYFVVKNQWEDMYTPNDQDKLILSEMTQMVVASEDYKTLSENENIYAIESYVDRNKGGVYPFHYGVSVRTSNQTYLFSCNDKSCKTITKYGTTASRYANEDPVLPLKK